MAVKRRYIPFLWKDDRWLGGLSEDSRIGYPGAFRFGIGIDYRTDTGYLGVARKPVRHNDDPITDPIYWIEQDPNTGDVYYYGGRHIYKESKGHTTIIYEVTEDGAKGQGLRYFDHALYFRSPTKLGQLDLTTGDIDPDWQTGLATTRLWGPMCGVKNVMLFGHGRYVGTVDDVQFTNQQALVLPPDYFCRSIFRAGSFAVILATYGEKITDSEKGMMFLWDTTSDVYNDDIPIDGNPHAGVALKNKILIIAGQQPTIQESLGGQTEIIQGIPHIEDGKTAEVYPGAVDGWRNMMHFGISDGTSETAIRAVYSYGSKKSGINVSLNPEFPTSAFDISHVMSDLLSSGVQITACKQIGNTFRFACAQNGQYWIDQIDMNQYQYQAIHRTLAFDNTDPYEKVPMKILQELKAALQTGESVKTTISPDPFGDPDFTDTATNMSMTEDEVGTKLVEMPFGAQDNPIRSRDVHIETRLMGTGATRPAVKRRWAQLDEDWDQV